jgi:hypothetical protein
MAGFSTVASMFYSPLPAANSPGERETIGRITERVLHETIDRAFDPI